MLAGRRLRRPAHVPLAAMLLLAACGGGSDDAAPDSSPLPTTTVATAPATSPAPPEPAASTVPTTRESTTTTPPTTHHATTSPATSVPATAGADLEDLVAAVTDDVPCDAAWEDRSGDEVTFVRGRDLFTYRPATGDVACLARLDREPRTISWSPDGTTVLVDSDLLVDADGARRSGFAAGTPGIRWSKPNGLSLIAPSADGSELVHIDIGDPASARDVGALVDTWVADYHPSGEAIVSAGVDADGRRGLFLADNDGGQLTQLVTLEDPADTITEVAFGPDGRWVDFVHDHAGVDDGVAAHVHRFDIAGVFVGDLATMEDVVPSDVVTSRQIDGSVAYVVDRSTVSNWTERVNVAGSPVGVSRLAEHRFQPIGFLDEGTLAGVDRPVPERDAPGELRLVGADGEPMLVARDVAAAAVRVEPFPTWEEPPIGVILQAVG